jgi:hypothetical protein
MDSAASITDAVRDQFALLAPQPGTSLAAAIDRACDLVDEHERHNDIAWNAWLDDQRKLEDAEEEIRRLRQQLVGHPSKEEAGYAA